MAKKKTANKKSAPWNRPSPQKKGKHTKLTAKSKKAAKTKAKRAGRKYPNLVDNMRAAKRQKKSKKSCSTI